MRKHIFILVAIAAIAIAVVVRGPKRKDNITPREDSSDVMEGTVTKGDSGKVNMITQNLDTPWAIAFLPDGGMLVTERGGNVRLIDRINGVTKMDTIATVSSVREVGEGGLLGIAIHPDFSSNKFVYLYYTYSNSDGNTFNRVVRMRYEDRKLVDEKIVVDSIPGSLNHNGGRIKFGPDRMLYITTGDAQNPSLAQDKNALAGKILRVTDDGKPAPGNPFGNEVYSYGHRNPQGIVWDDKGNLWATEHGPSGAETGNDELNRIFLGGNYGWPTIRGKRSRRGMLVPILESGEKNTWAPSGIAYYKDKLFFAGLRGETLYLVYDLPGAPKMKELLKGEYGRLREVVLGPDNRLYITTSNQDGRGKPKVGDDKILIVDPEVL